MFCVKFVRLVVYSSEVCNLESKIGGKEKGERTAEQEVLSGVHALSLSVTVVKLSSLFINEF